MSIVLTLKQEGIVAIGGDSQSTIMDEQDTIIYTRSYQKVKTDKSQRLAFGLVGDCNEAIYATLNLIARHATNHFYGLLGKLRSGYYDVLDAASWTGSKETDFIFATRDGSIQVFSGDLSGKCEEVTKPFHVMGSGKKYAFPLLEGAHEPSHSPKELAELIFHIVGESNRACPYCNGFTPVYIMEERSVYAFHHNGKQEKLA